jgi:hypothetical protein
MPSVRLCGQLPAAVAKGGLARTPFRAIDAAPGARQARVWPLAAGHCRPPVAGGLRSPRARPIARSGLAARRDARLSNEQTARAASSTARSSSSGASVRASRPTSRRKPAADFLDERMPRRSAVNDGVPRPRGASRRTRARCTPCKPRRRRDATRRRRSASMRPRVALTRVYAGLPVSGGPRSVSPPIRDPLTLFQPDGVTSRYGKAASRSPWARPRDVMSK